MDDLALSKQYYQGYETVAQQVRLEELRHAIRLGAKSLTLLIRTEGIRLSQTDVTVLLDESRAANLMGQWRLLYLQEYFLASVSQRLRTLLMQYE